MIFPQLGPEYYNEAHKGIRSRMEASYAEAITINQSFWSEADTDLRFYNNDQTLWNDLYGGNLPANRRRQFNFNRIRPNINMISGYQRRNRKSTIVTPVENGDAFTADQFTKVMLWANNQENVLETISEAFESALITGLSFLHVWMDYRQDPVSGNIRVDMVPYNYFIQDPFFKKHDLSDCNFLWHRSFISKRECVTLLPDHAEEIMGLVGNSYGGAGRDAKFQYTPESYNYSLKNLLTYDEYYYRDYRSQKMLVDTQTGETMEWKSNDQEGLKRFLQTYPSVTLIEQDIPTVKLAIVVQGKVMFEGANPMGIDKYPFVPVFAYYHPETPYYPYKIQGVVRGLRDAQYLYNRRKIIELDILESQITSGFIYKENALVNPKDVFLQGQGRGLALKEEAAMTDVQQIQAPQIPPSMIELSKILGDEIQKISGVNEELLGSASDDKAGILSMLRQGAGLTTLQGLFDQLDRSQKMLGQLMLDLIQVNFMPGKVKTILEGEEPAPQFYNKAFGKYNCVVEEGLNTSTQKQMQFAQMLHLREVGVPIPNETLLEACTVQNKQKLIDSIKQNQQAQQQQQQQALQAQMQLQQAQAELAHSRAMADQGLYAERTSRVAENRALAIQKIHEANKNDEQALLEKVKALKELENMDINHIEKLLNMANLLKQQEKQAAEREPLPS